MLLQPDTGFSLHTVGGSLCQIVWSKISGVTIYWLVHTYTHTHLHANTVTQMQEPVSFLAPSPRLFLHTCIKETSFPSVKLQPSMKGCGKTGRDFHLLWALYVLKYYGLSLVKSKMSVAGSSKTASRFLLQLFHWRWVIFYNLSNLVDGGTDRSFHHGRGDHWTSPNHILSVAAMAERKSLTIMSFGHGRTLSLSSLG